MLSDEVISAIRCGEVIQRPVNVVKELLENSIDAGAKNILVKIEQGGKKSIEVGDDGCGMSFDDAKMSFLPHATSKVRSMEDLSSIKSLGFRGEALHSIASVSMLEMRTKEKGTDVGTLVSFFGGKLTAKPTGCVDGTHFVVKALFYNLPPRKSSLKADAVETAAISRLIGRYILLRPDINISYYVNGALHLIRKEGMSDDSVVSAVFGSDVASDIQKVRYELDGVSVSGFIGSPKIVRRNSDFIVIGINGRYIEDTQPYLKIIRDAYRHSIQSHEYPVVILRMEIDPGKIDPNVHPQKSSVGILDGELFKRCLYETISTCQRHLHPRAISPINSITPLTEASPMLLREDMANAVSNEFSETAIGEIERYPQEEIFDASAPQVSAHSYGLPEMEVLGQYRKMYIMACSNDMFFLIDQHALHEKILFEELFEKTKIETVKPVSPYVLHLSPEDSDLLESSVDLFKEHGLEIDRLDNETWKCYSVPSVCGEVIPEGEIISLIRDTVKNLSDKPDLEEFRRKVLAEVACKSAIRANDVLTHADMTRLVLRGRTMKDAYYCPHGRPSVKAFKTGTVDKWFKRN